MDNNDFILKIVAELEDKGIKTGFDKLKKAIEKDPAKIDVILDTSGTLGRTKGSVKKLAAEIHNEISVAISKLQNQGQDINFDLSVGDVEEVINKVINHTKKLEQNFDSASAKAQKFLAQFNKKSGGVLINSAEFQEVQKAIDGLGNTHSIEDLNKSMNTLEVTYNNIVSNLRNGGKSLNPFINAINDMKNMDSTLKGIELDYQSLASKPKDVSDSIKELYTQQQKVNQYSQGTIEWSQEYGILQSKIVQVKNEIQNIAKAEKASNTDESNRVSYYRRIIENNKTIYSLKNKLLTADQEQTKEINRQIKALEERNRYNYNQLSKKGLTDNSWEQNVNSSKNALENQLRINEAKQNDITHTREIAQAEKEAASAAKERQSLEAQVNKIQLSMEGKNKKSQNYDYQIDTEIKKLKDLGFTDEEVAQKVKVLTDAQEELKRVMDSSDFDSVAAKNQAIVESDKERTIALNQVRTAYGQLKNDASQYYNLNKQAKLSTDIQNWLSKNSRASKESKESLNAYYRELSNGRVSVDRLNYIEKELKDIDAVQRGLGKLGKNLKDQFAEAGRSFTQWLSVSSGIMLLVSKIKNAITELKEVNSIMTEISKTADQLSKAELSNVEKSSYKTASKYGKKASDYLTGVQEMYRAGYENAESLAELSTLAQAAGDMQADLANDYIIATDAAYKLKGNTEALNAVLDGQNYITNRNALSMQDLAEATKIAASQSASSGIAVDKATAAMGTMIATTRQGGDVAARAWKGILMNIQQVEGEVDDGEVIDAESLSKYEKACEALGVSLKEVKGGIISLRDPMQILKELSEAYTSLDESDARRANLISAVGGKYRGNQLNALLENWSLYEKMLKDYAEGSGSAMEEAMKSANNWEGSMNRLGNTFTKVVNNIVKSDAVIAGANGLNGLLSVIDKVTSKLGSLGTIGIGGSLILGRDKSEQRFCPLWVRAHIARPSKKIK